MVNVASIVGARPNFVKMAPVIATLRRRDPDGRQRVIHTGQHYDPEMSQIFFEQLGMPEPDELLGVGSGSHAVQTARVMERLEPLLVAEPPDVLLVPGDVNSTLAAALVAAKLGIPIGHIESGLRSFDRTMPEEINRIVADEFSRYLFIHSPEAIDNLHAQGIGDDRIFFVGNTMIDSLMAVEERFRALNTASAYGVEPGEYLLVTLHRPALVDGPLLGEVLEQLAEVARDIPVLFPAHPRTQARIGDRSFDGVTILEPLGYLEFLSLEADARAVLTDSGGVQEETTYLGVPCFTLRASTERPVTVGVGTNRLLGLDPSSISSLTKLLDEVPSQPGTVPELWDGRASERIADVLLASPAAG
jgi:UDP-N-acetylglucosamine 2-epimerase (non-hydrolysing)